MPSMPKGDSIMNDVTTTNPQSGGALVPWNQLSNDDLLEVLIASIYPGAKRESALAVIQVCRISGKDPLKKPYHIVPMYGVISRDDRGKEVKGMRDVIMPGINDYRVDASRTGEHIGTSEPEFGPEVTRRVGEIDVTFPEWCKVTVKRRKGAEIAEFSAIERWIENYAWKRNDDSTPNVMWMKRTYGQLAKCTEAQALRKGFPEVGNSPTAEEMEGKSFDDGEVIEGNARVVETPKPKTPQPKQVTQQKAEDAPSQGEQIEDAVVEEIKDEKTPEVDDSPPVPAGLLRKLGTDAQAKDIGFAPICERYGIKSEGKEYAHSDVGKLTTKQANDAILWIKGLPYPEDN
jgi:phage recombination protein Bet